jgi:hypothetical protein
MNQICDALELLTAQHEEIDELCERIARYRDAAAFDELADKLPTHLAVEQELFYPNIDMAQEVRAELIAEHVAIKRLLGQLVWMGVEDEDFGELFSQLGELLLGHTAYQEDHLFTAFAETMPADRLAALCSVLQQFDTFAVAA